MPECPQSAPTSPAPLHGFCRIRLLSLAQDIRASVSGAVLSEVIPGAMGFHSMTVSLSNGLVLLVSTDADLPEALFEVIRFVDSDSVQQYPFEPRVALGSAYSDKLTTPAVLHLLNRYLQPDVAATVSNAPNARSEPKAG